MCNPLVGYTVHKLDVNKMSLALCRFLIYFFIALQSVAKGFSIDRLSLPEDLERRLVPVFQRAARSGRTVGPGETERPIVNSTEAAQLHWLLKNVNQVNGFDHDVVLTVDKRTFLFGLRPLIENQLNRLVFKRYLKLI